MGYALHYSWASLVAQLVRNLPVMQENWVRSLGGEDPLEKEQLSTPLLFSLERGLGIALQARQEKKALTSRGRGRLRGFLELRRPWGFICSDFGAQKNKV